MTTKTIRGRCIAISGLSIQVRNEKGTSTVSVSRTPKNKAALLGSIIEIQNGTCRILTPNRSHRKSIKWMEHILNKRRMHATGVRSEIENTIRNFFSMQKFQEVHTPLLVPCPGMEPHIKPFKVHGGPREFYLPTSPEFAMKRLLVGGLEKIFQICPSFRDEVRSKTHLPEFTMLEWYRAYAGYEKLMDDVEELFRLIAKDTYGKSIIKYGSNSISLSAPWPRLSVRQLFMEHAGIDLVKCDNRDKLANECKQHNLRTNHDEDWDDIFFKIWLNIIEPKLPQDKAVFIYRYPPSQAALSALDTDPDGSIWAKRFEVFIGGMELGNAFEELTDPIEQRMRFKRDMQRRKELYGAYFPETPIDEEFLHALEEGLPPCSGIAIGLDRMVMLFANEPEIEYTKWVTN
ncbi:MAG: EF-P lysine aminoacylase EpmA [Candidatus Poribacteria bacterium]